MAERIEARVAQILNARELVLNKGEEHGVKVGMRFAILNSRGAGIIDPDTGEPLGSVEVEKAIVKVVRTQDRLAVARTFRKLRSEGLGSSIGLMREFFAEDRVETLQTDERTYKQEITEEESYVKTGDVAVQVIGDEYQAE